MNTKTETAPPVGSSALVMPRREDCAIETMRCDECNRLLAGIERAEARDTGFQECRDCGIERHNNTDQQQICRDILTREQKT